MLGMMGGRAIADDLPEDHGLFMEPLGWGAMSQSMLPLAVRGLWGVAKIGKPQLAAYKRALPGRRPRPR